MNEIDPKILEAFVNPTILTCIDCGRELGIMTASSEHWKGVVICVRCAPFDYEVWKDLERKNDK